VFVISDTLARRWWPGEDPVGARVEVRWEGAPVSGEVIGVVQSVRHDALDRPARPELFMAHAQEPYGSMTFVARTAAGSGVTLRALEEQLWAVDPLQPFYRTATLGELIDRTLVGRRFSLALFGAFALIGMALAAAGLFAVVSFTTAQRTREFGVRLALGARPADIGLLVVGDGLRLTVWGLAIGGLLALWGSRLLRSLLFGVSPHDPATFAAVAALLLALSALGCYLPSRRAVGTDPVRSLRLE
jgi:putative ABC transport system permease protein